MVPSEVVREDSFSALAEGECDSSHCNAFCRSLLLEDRAVRASCIGTGRVLRSWAMRVMGTLGSVGGADCDRREVEWRVRRLA